VSADAATLNEVPRPEVDAHDPPSRWKLLSSTLRDQRRNLIIGSLIGLLWMVGKISVPILVRFSIDRGIDEGDRLWLWVLLIAVAGVAIGMFTAMRRYYAFREARWTETRLRERLFNHIMSLHVGYHDRAQTGQLMSRSSSDLQQIQSFVVMIPITMSNLGMILAATVILFATDPILALVALAPLPLVNIAGRKFSTSIHSAVLQVQAEQAELATVVEESIGGVRVVKGFGAEAVQATRLRKEADDIRGVSIGAARIRAKYLPAIELLPQLGLIAVLGLGGLRVINGDLTLGQLVQFNFFVALLVSPLRMLGMTIAWAQRAGAALERVNEVLDAVPEVVDPEHPQRLTDGPARGAVSFRSVRFGYDPAAPVLDRFELELAAGESVALVGATGSGKSTVARLIPRFYDVDEGRCAPRRGRRARRSARRCCAARSGSCSRRRSCSPTPSPRTSRSPIPMHPRTRSNGRPSRRGARLHRRAAGGVRHHHRRARVLAVGWPAPAHRHRPGDPRRPSCLDPRRRHLVGRSHQGARDPRRPAGP
jgi:ATP-binding cassette, subfamily B, bacterial